MDKQPRQHKSAEGLDVARSQAKASPGTLEQKRLDILG